MTDTIATRVARGAALLDDRVPGWYDDIALKSLDQESISDCVLGQTFGSFPSGMEALFDGRCSADDSAPHGFGATHPTPVPNEFELLNIEWERVILARRGSSQKTSTPAFTLTASDLVDLVTRAMDYAPTRGNYSEIGLTYTWLSERGLV
jgi:hypothetical protein